MSTQRFDLITASLAGAINAWYNATIDGDTAIMGFARDTCNFRSQ
jgi:hypothetical protein